MAAKSLKPVLLSLCALGVVSWVGYQFYQAYQLNRSAYRD